MNDQGGVGEGDAARGAGSANPPNIPEGPYSSADFDLNDTVRTAVTDYTDASSTARSLQGLRGPKLDWWFPAKAAFGRKKDVAVAELFDRLTRPSMNTNTKIDSFLLRDSVDADKIETRQSKWIDRGKGYFHKQVSERARARAQAILPAKSLFLTTLSSCAASTSRRGERTSRPHWWRRGSTRGGPS